MNPTFVSRMLQSLAESTNGFNTGRRSPEAVGGTCIHSLRSSLLKQEEDEDDGEKALTLSGQRKRGGAGGQEIDSVDIWLRKWNSKHLFVSKIYILAAQSFPFKVWTVKDACVHASARSPGQGTELEGTPEPGRLRACPHVALSRGARRSGCLPWERTWKEKPAFWCAGFSLRVVSLLAEEAQITTWILFLFFI